MAPPGHPFEYWWENETRTNNKATAEMRETRGMRLLARPNWVSYGMIEDGSEAEDDGYP